MLEYMLEDARRCNRRMKTRDNSLIRDIGEQVRNSDKIERRAPKLCAACDKYLRPDQVKKHNHSNWCGSQGCKNRLDRWRAFR